MMETKDLALATTLRMYGCEPSGMVMDGREAWWVFPDTENVSAIEQRYRAGECRVDPREYNLKLRRTRDQLFDFLNKHGVFASKPAW